MSDAPLAAGIDTNELEPSIRPQDDLFRHVNERWIERTEIPSDKARYGSFYLLAEEAEKAVKEIILESQSADPGTEARKVGDLYASFMDEARIQALGAQPIAELLETAAAASTIDEVLATLGRLERGGAPGLFAAFVDNDPGQPDRYLVFLEQAGLGLPDESYYREENFAEIRTKYVAFIERMLGLVGLDDPAARASRIMALETELASHHWDNVTNRDSEKTYNPMLWQRANDLAGSLDMDVWLTALGVPEHSFDEVVVRQPSFLEGLQAVLRDENLAALQDWLAWQVVRSNAAYLSQEFVEANFDFYGRTLTGTPQLRDRWKRGVSLVEGALGEAVGHIYVERHFPEAAKTAMDVLVANLVEAYRQSIEKLDWMGPATRERALEKLSKFTPKIGYPVKWRDYSNLAIDAADLIGNIRATNEFEFQRELGKIGKPLDRDEWFMTPQTINAYYNPGFNEIVFPAAILQFPFFDENRDAAANYGAIGAVIGHEIGHGFDDQGSKSDGDGVLRNWWTPADKANFEALTARLGAQYATYEPIAGYTINPGLTMGENIGDASGVAVGLEAYHLSLAGKPAPVLDGTTGDQRFFYGWAQVWQSKYRDEALKQQVATDPHSAAQFRVIGPLRNVDAWYDAFDVEPGTKYYLTPEERVRIW